MASLDIYDESEHIISSDEYSEEDEDDLINVAISSKNDLPHVANNLYGHTIKKFELKNKEESRIKAKKFSILAKKKSVKWLNGKKKREKYKQLLLKIKHSTHKKIMMDQEVKNNDEADENNTDNHLHIDITDVDMKAKEKELESKGSNKNVFSTMSGQNVVTITNGLPKIVKRCRSMSPTLLKSIDKYNDSEIDIINNVMLYKEINKLFPKHNKALESIVRSSSDTTEKIDHKITQTLLEIQALSEMIQTKELEWNKLLHLRKVKEEIILHLVRKKNVMELKKRRGNKTKFHSYDIRSNELDTTRSSDSPYSEKKNPTTVHSLVENRANMGKEDLEKEQLNINRLHSILVSGNILPSNYIIDKYHSHRELDITTSETDYRDQSIRGQGVFKDVKRIIADFREKNPDMAPRRGRRIKLNDQKIYLKSDAENIQNKSISILQRGTLLNKPENHKCLEGKKSEFNENEVPLCQACNTHEARFVCAGCGSQWYCSRRCQVSAWDKHSDTCKE